MGIIFLIIMGVATVSVLLYVLFSFRQDNKVFNSIEKERANYSPPMKKEVDIQPSLYPQIETTNDKKIFIAGISPQKLKDELEALHIYDIKDYEFRVDITAMTLAHQALTILTFPDDITFETFVLLIYTLSRELPGKQICGWSTIPSAYTGIDHETGMVYYAPANEMLYVIGNKQNKYYFDSQLTSGVSGGKLTKSRKETEKYIQPPLSSGAIQKENVWKTIRIYTDNNKKMSDYE
ncbi:MAG: hypothetical protein LUG98_12605 [Tannerellaceae bacterium]|nr:hypothetical protein [Tannerellaceae bacterium]